MDPTRDDDDDDAGGTVLECWLVRAHGRVQGIGYRAACIDRARASGLTGWVRNRLDGSVEAMLQGTPERLAAACEWLRDGVPGAWVEKLDVSVLAPPFHRCDGFDQLPTR